MAPPARVGIVLAGGFGTRFETGEKALATLEGDPLLGRAIAGVAPAVDGVVVSCREEQLSAFKPVFDAASVQVTPAPDPVPDRGPVAGIATALEPVDTPWIAVVAGDMPFVDAAFLNDLFDRAGETDGAAAEVDGHRQSTHAVYRTAPLRDAVEDARETGDRSLQAVLERLDLTVVPEATVRSLTRKRTFFDVNTVEDLSAARDILSEDDGRVEWESRSA